MNKVEYVRRYQEKRDAIMLRPSKEDGAKYRAAAKAAGMSVQGYIFQALREYMERHKEEEENKTE